MPRGKEQKLHLIVKRPNQCCQARLCSAQGLEPQPLLTSKMLLFLQLASAGVAEACLNLPKQRELCSREPWVRLLGLVFFWFILLSLTGPVLPRERGFTSCCLACRIECESQMILLLLYRALSCIAHIGFWLVEVITGLTGLCGLTAGAVFSSQSALQSPN